MSDAPFTKSPDGSGNPRAVSVRVKSASASTIGGQNAHDLRKGAQPFYVDPARTHLNRVIFEPLTGSHLREIALERRSTRATARSLKSNAAVGYVGIITFGHIAQTYWAELTHEEQDRALRTITDRIASRLKTTVTGLVLHRDEQAEHAHFQMPGYDLDGNPLSQTARRHALAELQTIAAEVMQRFDSRFERGFSKENRLEAGATPAQVKNKTVAQLHQTQAADLEKARSTLAALNEKIEKNTRLIEKAEARIEAGKGDLAKLNANIETYTRRLQAARFEAEQEEARLAANLAHNKKRKDEAAAKTRAAESEAAAAQDREKAARAREQEALDRQKAAFEQFALEEAHLEKERIAADEARLEAAKKAYERANDLIQRAMDLARSDPAALHDPARPGDPEAKDLPPPDYIRREIGKDPTRLDRFEFGTAFDSEQQGGRRLPQSASLKGFIKTVFAAIRHVADYAVSERERLARQAAEAQRTARSVIDQAKQKAEDINKAATPQAFSSLQDENSKMKIELEQRHSFFKLMQSIIKSELGEKYAPLAEKVNSAWARRTAQAPAAPKPSAPPARPSGPSGP